MPGQTFGILTQIKLRRFLHDCIRFLQHSMLNWADGSQTYRSITTKARLRPRERGVPFSQRRKANQTRYAMNTLPRSLSLSTA
jgi:hypothetical protein